MEQKEKIHLKRFAKRLKDALRLKTGWGRSQLYELVDELLINYLIDEGDLEMEEKDAIDALGGLQVRKEEVALRRGQKSKSGPKEDLTTGEGKELPPF